MNAELWEKAQRIFKQAAELPAAERDDFVRDACDGNGSLLDIVRGLLRGDEISGDAPLDAVVSAGAEWRQGRADPHIGQTIGAFRIEEQIAEGGMGIVYRARRADQQFDQQVAVKLIATRLATDLARQRFLAERQILANLDHPNIASLLDGGETDDGNPYLVMEFIEGLPIDEFCDQHALSTEERIILFVSVCAAVQHAHQNLVVHRDIKAGNVLVTAEGVPKLLDFGIAKLMDDSAPGALAGVTVEGSRALTMRNASPEQIKGQAITTATDVYSLGLLLYELLTSAYPFDLDGELARAEVAEVICEADPRPPSAAVESSKVWRELQGDLDTIVLRCLRKQAEHRYASPLELADDLQRHLASIPIVARPRSFAYLASRYWRRHKAVVVGALATTVATVGGAIVATVGYYDARNAEQLAQLQTREAEAISGFLTSIFEEADPNNTAGSERTVREMLDISLARLQTDMAETPELKLGIVETLAGVYKSLAEYSNAAILFQEAIVLAEAIPAEPVVRARLLNEVGDIYRIQSRLADAQMAISESVRLYRAIPGAPPQELANALNNLALTLQESGDLDSPRALYEETLRLRESVFESPHPDIALSYHNLSYYFGRIGEYELAEQHARTAIDMRIALYGENHPRVASTVGQLSRVLRDQRRWDEAEAEARRSVAIAEAIFDSGHPDLSFPMYELAMVLREKGQLVEARDLLLQVLEWETVSMGLDSQPVAMNLKSLGELYLDLGEYDVAETYLRSAEATLSAIGGNDASAISATLHYGIANLRAGRLVEAENILESASTFVRENWASDAAVAVLADIALGELAIALDDSKRLDESASRLRDFALSGELKATALLIRAQYMLGRIEQVTGNLESAEAEYVAALEHAAELWPTDHWFAVTIGRDLKQLRAAMGEPAY